MLIRSATFDDAELLADRLRAADRAELEADGHTEFFTPIETGLRASVLCRAVFFDGELACIFGLVPNGRQVFGDIGVPWALGTDVLTTNVRQMRRVAREYLQQMLQLYPVLLNFVHAENTLAIRALRHMKFTLDEPAPYGPNGEPFRRFEMRRV